MGGAKELIRFILGVEFLDGEGHSLKHGAKQVLPVVSLLLLESAAAQLRKCAFMHFSFYFETITFISGIKKPILSSSRGSTDGDVNDRKRLGRARKRWSEKRVNKERQGRCGRIDGRHTGWDKETEEAGIEGRGGRRESGAIVSCQVENWREQAKGFHDSTCMFFYKCTVLPSALPLTPLTF